MRATPPSPAERDLARRVRMLEEELRQAREHAAGEIERRDRMLAARDETLRALQASSSWRLTAPLRWAMSRLGGRAVRAHAPAAAAEPKAEDPLPAGPVDTPAADLFGPRVLIVAELSIPQCAKYRVWQKQRHFWSLGVDCQVLAWPEYARVRNALQAASLVIFYRAPAAQPVLDAVAEARRLKVPTVWEVDDLIFDEAALDADTPMPPELRDALLGGVEMYRPALQACDYGLGSTAGVAEAMRVAGVRGAFVVENGLDEETLAVAGEVVEARRARPRSDEVVIVYGSGTRTHDLDFLEAAPAIERLMRIRPQVRLRVIGALTLPDAFAAFGERVERLAGVEYAAYLRLLGEADISLAPLAPSRFNDAKSNIKYLEAAVLGLPSVCSPRAAFAAVIEPGVDGLLADTTEEWLAALTTLVEDPQAREAMGRAAAATARRLYAPEAVAERQVRPLLERLAPAPARAGVRVLATASLDAEPGVEVVVLASRADAGSAPQDLVRYEADGRPTIGVQVGGRSGPELAALAGELLDAIRPDAALVTTGPLGEALAEACRARELPCLDGPGADLAARLRQVAPRAR